MSELMPWEKPCTLYIETSKLLREDNRSTKELAKVTKLPFNWLSSVRIGRIEAPNVHRIQFIYEFLTGEPLQIHKKRTVRKTVKKAAAV